LEDFLKRVYAAINSISVSGKEDCSKILGISNEIEFILNKLESDKKTKSDENEV